jgi:nucleotide-binding universal stress UspA family protein
MPSRPDTVTGRVNARQTAVSEGTSTLVSPEHPKQGDGNRGEDDVDSSAQPDERQLVVGVDGTRFGVAALRWAMRDVAARGGSVEVVMAWHPESELVGVEWFSGQDDAIRQRCAQALASSVEEACEGRSEPRQVLARGWPPEVLVQASRGADLLVLGSHGRVQLMARSVGSVVEYCLHHAFCPVIALPPRLAVPTGRASDLDSLPAASSFSEPITEPASS